MIYPTFMSQTRPTCLFIGSRSELLAPRQPAYRNPLHGLKPEKATAGIFPTPPTIMRDDEPGSPRAGKSLS